MINYYFLQRSIDFYAGNGVGGFQKIEVPWIVPYWITEITLPKNKHPFSVGDGDLVGSAEQGFLYLVSKFNLKGDYQAISPCFRRDDEDELHSKYFMKNELFSNNNVSQFKLNLMTERASKLFSLFGIDNQIIPMSEGTFDIIDSKFGIELGSYGIRSHSLLGQWVYGTGLAEPRFSTVLSKIKNSL